MSKATEFLSEFGVYEFLDNAKISESSLSRLLTQINSESKDFAMLTAFRGTLSKKENRKRNKELMSKFIKPNKIGATKVIGAFKEKGQDDVGKEETFFLIRPDEMDAKLFKKIVLDAVKEFDQDAALVGISNVAFLMFPDGTTEKIGSPAKFDTEDLDGAFTRIKGKTFKFEGMYVPSGFMNAMCFKGSGLSYSLSD
jgi:hypothetical protein